MKEAKINLPAWQPPGQVLVPFCPFLGENDTVHCAGAQRDFQGSASSLGDLGEFGWVVSLKTENKVGVQLGNSLPMNLPLEEWKAWLLSRH